VTPWWKNFFVGNPLVQLLNQLDQLIAVDFRPTLVKFSNGVTYTKFLEKKCFQKNLLKDGLLTVIFRAYFSPKSLGRKVGQKFI
jgi:hypothetical protein